jgi:predicted TIM-barrel fold metal-dependent hydrolase
VTTIQKEAYMIIDSNVHFGFDRLSDIKMDPESILKRMDRSHIDKAIVTCNECEYLNFVEGNDATATVVKSRGDRFIGFFSLNPGRYIGVVDEVDRAVEKLGLVGFRMYFTEVSFGRGWSSGLGSLMLERVMAKVKGYSLPVFLEAGFSFADMKHFADRYPYTPIIAAGVGYANMAEAIVAAQTTRNLYLEISGLDSGDGVRFLAKEVGSEKIIFGSNIPFSIGSVPRLLVEHSDIPERDKENIFSKNILRILGGSK